MSKPTIVITALLMIGLSQTPALAEAPLGWSFSTTTPKAYRAERTEQQPHGGRSSGRLVSISQVALHQYALLGQKVSAARFQGQRVKVSGYLKASGVKGWSGLWARADDAEGSPVAFQSMESRPLRGDSEWQPFSIELDVPAQADELHFGMLLAGAGEVSADDFRVEAIGPSQPARQLRKTIRDPETEFRNLDFER